jgi:hypothetical protein
VSLVASGASVSATFAAYLALGAVAAFAAMTRVIVAGSSIGVVSVSGPSSGR